MRRPAPWALAWFGAGLATGLARFWAPVGALWLLPLAMGARVPALGLAGGVGGIGWLLGRVARAADERGCAARLLAGDVTLQVRLMEPAAAGGGRVALAAAGGGCRGVLPARWPRGIPAAAGAVGVARGRWLAHERGAGRARGFLLVQAWRQAAVAPTAGDRVRAWVQHSSSRLFGPRASLVDAFVIGRRAELDPGLVADFRDSGLTHLLAISGFHVGIMAGWCAVLLRAAHRSRRTATLAGLAVATGYSLFLGWPAPAARATLALAIVGLTRLRQRAVDTPSLMAVALLGVLALDPFALTEVGAWLSATALWGSWAAERWVRRELAAGPVLRAIAASTGALAATAPITVFVFGTAAPIAVVLNLVAVPMCALAVPALFLAVALGGLGVPGAGALAAGGGLLLEGLQRLAAIGARVPGGHLVLVPGAAAALPWVGLLVLAGWIAAGHVPARVVARRAAVLLAAAAWVLVAAEEWRRRAAAANTGALALHFLDVGQGDAALLRTPRGRWIAVDAGPRDARRDAGATRVLPALRRAGARALDILFVSHAHADHLGGAAALLEAMPVGLVVEPGRVVDDPLYQRFLALVGARAVPWRAGRSGDRWTVDGVTLRLVHPDTAWGEFGLDLNEDSLVLLVEYGAFRAALVGDAGFHAEQALGDRLGDVDLLKVGHHGSRTASGAAWLARLRPEAAVVSLGRGNRYGHPSPEALARLAAARARVWRTDRDGTVTVRTDGRDWHLETARGATQQGAAGAPARPPS